MGLTSKIFEVSQIWFHVLIQCPPAPQKSVLGFGLAQKLGFWGPSSFYLRIISKSFLPEAVAASKMVQFSIWGCQNDGKTSLNKVCQVNFFRNEFWAKSNKAVLTSENFEVSQIWFDVAIQNPPAPQKSGLKIELAQKLRFWGQRLEISAIWGNITHAL